ncbi:MAG: hypothetical protein ACUVS7_03300 [Bryobacteraceae bacterium]
MFAHLAVLLLASQNPAPASEAGLLPDWELRPRVAKLLKGLEGVKPLLERLEPERWTAAGAPGQYEQQHRDCLASLGHVENAATRLAARPSGLAVAVETLVRLENFVNLARSLSEALRRYQNPAMADLLESELAAAADREWLRSYVLELSAVREREWETAEQEAQRCRERTLKQVPRK